MSEDATCIAAILIAVASIVINIIDLSLPKK